MNEVGIGSGSGGTEFSFGGVCKNSGGWEFGGIVYSGGGVFKISVVSRFGGMGFSCAEGPRLMAGGGILFSGVGVY